MEIHCFPSAHDFESASGAELITSDSNAGLAYNCIFIFFKEVGEMLISTSFSNRNGIAVLATLASKLRMPCRIAPVLREFGT